MSTWGILVSDNNKGSEFLAGIHYVGVPFLPLHMNGYDRAVYSTRADARAVAKTLRKPGIHALAVKVRVSVDIDQ